MIAPRTRVAQSLVRRLVGLLLTPSLPEGEALWIAPCNSVHTLAMRYAIDVLFLDDKKRVIYRKTLRPWRFSAIKRASRGVLELPEGTIERTRTECGDELEFKPL